MQADHTERAAFAEALRRAGYDVRERTDVRVTDEELRESDVAVVDLSLAIGAGWMRPVAPVPLPPIPLVAVSSFPTFLYAVRDRVAATVLLPAKAPAIVDAVARASQGKLVEPAPPTDRLASSDRDAQLSHCGALDTSTDAELFGVVDLVTRGVGAPIGVVSVVGSDHQTFVAHVGLPPDMLLARGSPRQWSFCQHAVLAEQPLVVPDARLNPALAGLPPVEMGLVRAYAGVPVRVDGVGVVGTVCVMSPQPREFRAAELAILELGARLVAARLSQRPASPSPTTPPPSHPVGGVVRVGELLDGKYWISARLGDGGQSQVFLARDRRSGQLVAIKVVRDPGGSGNLGREAATLARVRHPNIVQLHAAGRADGAVYLVLEYVEGTTLSDRLAALSARGEHMTLGQATTIVRELAGALTSLHAAGLVHGDVKPSNVLLDLALDRSVLIDFGLGLDPRGSSVGALGGTPGYSAPEQLTAEESVQVAPTLDVYGLAAIAYALLVSEGPFAGARRRERVSAQVAGAVSPPSARRSGLHRDIDTLVLSALSPRPAERPTSVLAFAEAFDAAIARSLADDDVEPPSTTTPKSRGLVFRGYREEVRRQFGSAEDLRAFRAIDSTWRAVFEAIDDDDELYPAPAFVEYLRAFAGNDLARLEVLGSRVSSITIPEALRAMRITRTPETLLAVVEPLLHRFHHWGKADVEVTGDGSAVVKLGLPSDFSPVMCHYFGGLLRAVLGMVGREAKVSHQSCAAAGAGSCVLGVRWAALPVLVS
jgi:hypothetical protein